MSASETVVKLASDLKKLEQNDRPKSDLPSIVVIAKRIRGMGLALTERKTNFPLVQNDGIKDKELRGRAVQ